MDFAVGLHLRKRHNCIVVLHSKPASAKISHYMVAEYSG